MSASRPGARGAHAAARATTGGRLGSRPAGPAPVADPVLADYLAWLEFERAMSPNTVAAYRRDLERFAVWCSQRGADPMRATA
ncbi:MAG TPA: site-specific integrase, partial [Thermoleophilia bacterium]|nr:site-specific integrase [Thermoleophilia bacterium]